MIAALFIIMQFVVMPAIDKVLTGKATILAFEKPHLLAAANKLAIAGLISIKYCFFDIYYLVYASFAAVSAVDAIDC